jgi:hypothetical protein
MLINNGSIYTGRTRIYNSRLIKKLEVFFFHHLICCFNIETKFLFVCTSLNYKPQVADNYVRINWKWKSLVFLWIHSHRKPRPKPKQWLVFLPLPFERPCSMSQCQPVPRWCLQLPFYAGLLLVWLLNTITVPFVSWFSSTSRCGSHFYLHIFRGSEHFGVHKINYILICENKTIFLCKIFLVLHQVLTHDHSVNFIFIVCTVISKSYFVNLIWFLLISWSISVARSRKRPWHFVQDIWNNPLCSYSVTQLRVPLHISVQSVQVAVAVEPHFVN